MAIVKMKHLRLVAMRENRDTLLRLLQRMGCVEIDEPSVDESDPVWAGLTRPGTGGLSEARDRHSAVERALAVLKRSAPAKESLLKPQPGLTEGELFDERAAEAALREAEEINEMDRRLSTIHAEETKLLAQKGALAPWLSLDLPLDTQSTGQVVIQLGTLPANVPFAQAEGEVLAAGDLSQLTLVSADREQQYLLLVCHVSQSEAVLQTVKDLGWSRANLRDWSGTAAENTAQLDKELEQLAQEAAALEEKLSGMGNCRADLRRLADRTAVEVSREESRSHLLDTGQTFYLEGWVPAENWPSLQKAIVPLPLCLGGHRPLGGRVPQRAGEAEEQLVHPAAEHGHGDVLPAGLRLVGSQPPHGPLLHPVLRDYDGGHGLRPHYDAGLGGGADQEKAQGRHGPLLRPAGPVRREYLYHGYSDRRLLRRLPDPDQYPH